MGNYLGAIRKFVDLQARFEALYCIVDLHAITVPQDPAALADQTREVAAAYLAAGIDPEQAVIFNQSAVPEHTELNWLLTCVARMGWLNRMTQFKDKAGKDKERASVGLFVYPILMASDILVYRATHVPVGEDQKQHLELARDIAAKINGDFDAEHFFPLPEPLIQGPGARIMSLRDGTQKMSKSDPSDLSRIGMMDTPDELVRKIKKAKTDPEPLPETVEGLEGRPEAKNLVGIFGALSGQTHEEVLATYGGQGFGHFKPALADLAVATLAPISSEMIRLKQNPDHIDAVLRAGAERARSIAAPVVQETKKLFGFLT
ncbi:tryptophanyl-tRNA synthetase [Parvularcula bermudensis HTCC2503]|uniref:Tryptophan--tRNA ligase n=1 Tax=Parvularcula bermudensis (strain ATCC BAA-594 / HTCC2503 / KCTC 12087) TaxID=314260 RepID=E0THQ2_PARBH|nr:tryptophanyl-tRNA synthetase [Parvularcula bermudensis HTCC2503]